ncbi:MAG: LegC family aminotransferase [Oscillospiraceae bacterium]|nr:LegC family aminotransferase [Oscillospiraceae bacterium]
MEVKIPLSVPNLRGRELELLGECVSGEWVSTAGPYISELESALASYVGAKRAVACQSGTAGLHLALLEAGVKPGEAVIVPALSFIASANPTVYCGAHPIFMDCDDSLCLDPLKLREFCERECERRAGGLYESLSGRRIAAIEAVHIFGNLADMDAISKTAADFSLPLIEDACEALGSRWESGPLSGRYAGTVGDIGVYSFNGNKIITTGGGGMIVARDIEKLEHMRFLSTQAKADTVRFIHEEIGYNYRLTNLQAAVGIAQLERLEEFIETKKRNYELYLAEGVELLPFREGTRPNYWFYSHPTGSLERREKLMAALAERGIQTRPIWALLNTLKPYRGERAYKIERAPRWQESVLNLPCSTNLTAEVVRECARALREAERVMA